MQPTNSGAGAITQAGTSTQSGPAGRAGASRQATAPGAAVAAHGDEYSCARAWAALTAAHVRITGQLTAALDQACGLSINDFEILLRLDHEPPPGLRPGVLN